MALTAVAGGLALATYLDGKYQLKRDAKIILRLISFRKDWEKAEKEGRASSWNLLASACQKYPKNIAVWSRTGTYTFAEFHDRTVQYAQWLLEQGVRPGEIVSMYLQNSPEFLMIWWAILCIGATPAFINYNLEGKALLHCLNVAASRLLIVDENEKCQQRIRDSQEDIEKTAKIVILDGQTKQHVASKSVQVPGNEYRKDVTGDDPFCIIYTSGTTGMPKGCPFIMKRFHMLGPHVVPPYDTQPGVDRWYNSMPLYHGTGAITCAGSLVGGIGCAIAPRFSTSGFWSDIHDSESTLFVYVGETARYLLNAPTHPLERKHKLRVAYGNGLRPDVWKKLQERFNIPEIAEFFNSSEGMLAMVVHAKGPYLAACVGHHGLILRAFVRNTLVPVAIDHESGDIWRDPKTGFAKRMPYEEGGEILVNIPDKNEIEFKGYWKNESATNKKFVTDVFKKGDTWYRSGDALRRTPDGHWYFMDRLGDTYRWKSENVSTAEVAQVIGHFPGIAEANVYGVTVPNHEGRAGCAAIHVDPNSKADINFSELLKFARARLPRYAVPVFLRIQKASSHIHNHKQNKVPLRKEGVDPKLIGSEDANGKEDVIYWVPPKKDEFVVFGKEDWDQLEGGKAKL